MRITLAKTALIVLSSAALLGLTPTTSEACLGWLFGCGGCGPQSYSAFFGPSCGPCGASACTCSPCAGGACGTSCARGNCTTGNCGPGGCTLSLKPIPEPAGQTAPARAETITRGVGTFRLVPYRAATRIPLRPAADSTRPSPVLVNVPAHNSGWEPVR